MISTVNGFTQYMVEAGIRSIALLIMAFHVAYGKREIHLNYQKVGQEPSNVNDDVNLINVVLDLIHRNECDDQHCSISDTLFRISVTMSNSEGFKFLILIDKQITFHQVIEF